MTILEKANQILADKEANLLPENLRQGITCLGVDGTLIELVGEEKSVIATTEEQEITPAEGYNGITKIIVRPVTNAIDGNIKAENIKLGTTILGVEGSYEGEILVYPSVESLPTVANKENFAIVVTEESYKNSDEDSVLTKIHLPEQVVFENAQAELLGYIGLTPENAEIPIVEKTGSLTTTMYNFALKVNDGITDTLEVSYLSEDGITYTRDVISATGIFQYDAENSIVTSDIALIPDYDSALGENIYDVTGGHFLQEIVEPAFIGVYQFGELGWVRVDLDTSGANATANDIVFGKSAYINGEYVEGAITEYVAETGTIEAISTIGDIPAENKIQVGKIVDTDRVYRTNSYTNLQIPYTTLAETIGLTADKIKAGETILGITGTYGEANTEPEEPETTPITMTTGKTYNVTFADTVAEDIDLVEQATNNDLTIINDTETNMIYCASAYLIGFVTVTDTGTDAYQYMDANVIAKLQELAGTENVTVNGTTDRGWKHVIMADGVYTIDDTTTPEPVQLTVGALNYGGEIHDTLDVTAFNWLMTSVEEVTTGPEGGDASEEIPGGGDEVLIPDEGEM